MRNPDWSLVVFTILTQWSIGIILCLTVPAFLYTDASVFPLSGLSLGNPVFLALVFIGIATLASFLHLGSPTNAANALNNLSGSWLSREILAIGVYSLSLLAVFALGWKTGNIENSRYLLLLNSVSGLVLVWMMIRIYVMPTIPAWNSWYTPLSFALTVLCLGLLTILLMQYIGLFTFAGQIRKLFVISLLVILFTQLASGLIHQFQLEKMDSGIDGPVFNKGGFYKIFLARMAVLITAFPIIFIILFKPGFPGGLNEYFWAVLLVVMVITQEFAGRLLFYSSYFRVGV